MPFASPAGARFVTSHEGRSLGIGHIVMLADDVTATSDFYMNLVEFEPSDAIINVAVSVTFAHVNPRHHSLAFGAVKGSIIQGLDHLMLEVDDLDVVGCALARLASPLSVRGMPGSGSGTYCSPGPAVRLGRDRSHRHRRRRAAATVRR